MNRIRNIWNSELLDLNKAVAHNTIALPTLTFTVGLVKKQIKQTSKLEKPLQYQVVFIPTVMLIGYTFAEKMGEEISEL